MYEAFDRERDELVALKTVLRMDGSSLYRFKHEFRSLTNLTHRGLVRLYELFSEGNQWFFTMELVDGVDFLAYACPDPNLLEEETRKKRPRSCDESTVKDHGPGPVVAGPDSLGFALDDGASSARAGSASTMNEGLDISMDDTVSVAFTPSRPPSTKIDPECPPPSSPAEPA